MALDYKVFRALLWSSPGPLERSSRGAGNYGFPLAWGIVILLEFRVLNG